MPNAAYAPIPNPQDAVEAAERHMEDAFDLSDDEDDAQQETRPMIAARAASPEPASPPIANDNNTYNFEDWTLPPPGEPPRPSPFAYANNIFNNTNGVVGTPVARPPDPRGGWLKQRLRGILPARLTGQSQSRTMGSGLGNDGVFANVTAKPIAPSTANEQSRAEQGTSTIHVAPEFEQKDAPPTYAEAQQDAVPPYWDTTVLAPAGSGDELIVEGFPPGHVFSFVTSFFISFSFQFIGFMLTTIMATSHAAKFGSRAGLGITLVQYGLYLRSNEARLAQADVNGWPTGSAPRPAFTSSTETDDLYATKTPDGPGDYPEVPSLANGDYPLPPELTLAADWLSFFLMTVGWLLFLTSLLGFWRVKKWERSLRQSSVRVSPSDLETPGFSLMREGASRDFRRLFARLPQEDSSRAQAQEPELPPQHPLSRDPEPPMDPETRRRYEAALQLDRQIERELRRAGLL
ncbi:SubName: Full=Related to metal homeostasis protein {ECO:0000313/EMBL:CCA78079.1} [Serendipita indica DSM 11827]|uniref:Related to metal homeostasis protein n=1 Tax=Serendipita indica (strain DSM 11827) TaxID=1109443 RepID=G4U3A6_SERID|nr:SubName: Full=Related to metal homeostasis protein {ECO:0000313/EMBL:CCA78079.1} [Serendipita indica DSM 11827]CCA78079.1 related to metal homeostasis protein [Serendipita indica DSM 11827]